MHYIILSAVLIATAFAPSSVERLLLEMHRPGE
jgi:hypothetical protein